MNLQLSDKTQQVSSNIKTQTQFKMNITPFEEYPEFAYIEATEKVFTLHPNKIVPSVTEKEVSGVMPTALAEIIENFSSCEEWLSGFRLNIPMDSGKCYAVALTDEDLSEYQKSTPDFDKKRGCLPRVTNLPIDDNKKIYLWNFDKRQLFSLDLKMIPRTIRFYFGRAFNPDTLNAFKKTSPYPFEVSSQEGGIKILLPEKEYTDNTVIFYNEGPKAALDHMMQLLKQTQTESKNPEQSTSVISI